MLHYNLKQYTDASKLLERGITIIEKEFGSQYETTIKYKLFHEEIIKKRLRPNKI